MSTLDLTLDPEPVRVRRMEVIGGDVGRRTWSPEEKARILAEAVVPGVVVSEVARRHGLQPQLVFGGRRKRAASRSQVEGTVFAPVVLHAVPLAAAPTEPPAIEVHHGSFRANVSPQAHTGNVPASARAAGVR